MMRGLAVVALGLLACAALAQSGFTISGIVVAGDTNKPIKHVMVTVISVGRPSRQASYVTGEDGRFIFANLPAGKFGLSAQKSGSFPESFHENENYSTAIVTGPGLNSENIVFPLSISGSISGIVNDDQGDPVRDAEILLFHRAVISGKLQTRFQETAQTDSLGNFHFGRLRPGTYLIAVQARPWYAQNGFAPPDGHGQAESELEFDVAYPVTYYGGSTDPNSASSVALAEGSSSKIEITLRAVPAVHVQLSGANSVNIFVIGPGGYKIHASGMFIGSESSQQFTGIAPGRYIVQRGSGGSVTADFTGRSALDLANLPRTSISGHLNFEGDEHASADIVTLVSEDGTVLQAHVAQDGSFTTTEAQPGRYEIQLPDAQGYYVKSVLVGGHAVPDQRVDVIDGSAVQISILAAKGTSNIDGVAVKDATPFPGAMVLLLPQDLNRTKLIRRDQSDGDGTFTLPNAPPGRYTVVAIDDGHDLAYAEPSVIQPYLAAGQVIDVPLSRDLRVKVNVQHRRP